MTIQSVKKQSLKEMCKLEFKKINGLYHPSDKILIKEGNFYISCEYYSKLNSLRSYKEVGEPYKTQTRIMFGEFHSPELDIGATIGLISVHPKIRGRGFGRKLVETVESVFRKRGWDRIDVEHVDNPDFWEHLGYRQRIYRDKGIRFEFYTKDIS